VNRTVVIPGPEAVLWWGVHVPLLAAAFGVAGVLLGHVMAPVPATPLSLLRQTGVLVAGVLLSLGVTIATGQRPLVVLGWSIGIGFSGITIFQAMADQTRTAVKRIGDELVEQVAAQLGRGRGRGETIVEEVPDEDEAKS
jgi:hypothetical protein